MVAARRPDLRGAGLRDDHVTLGPVAGRRRDRAKEKAASAGRAAKAKASKAKNRAATLLGPPTKVTQFTAPIGKLSALIAYSLSCCLLAPRWPILPLAPLPYILLKTTKDAVLSGVHRAVITGMLTVVWGGLLVSLALPLVLAARLPPIFATLAVYSPFVVIYGRSDPEKYSWFARHYMRVCWDPPLVAVAWLTHRLLGVRLLQPKTTVMDDNVVVGALPFRLDVAGLRHELGVTGVVNMCEEWGGPKREYEKLGVEQLRLPTQDLCAPTVESLERGIAFIDERVRDNPGERVLIHCKSGRGRAATMALAWYVSRGHSPDEAIAWLHARREVMEPRVRDYSSIVELEKRYADVEPIGPLPA